MIVIFANTMQTNRLSIAGWLGKRATHFIYGTFLVFMGLVSHESSALGAEPSVALKLHASGFTSPVAFAPLNDGKGTMVLADQVGNLSLVNSAGIVRGQPFLSLSDRITKLNTGFDERGILGFAAHPKFAKMVKFTCITVRPFASQLTRSGIIPLVFRNLPHLRVTLR